MWGRGHYVVSIDDAGKLQQRAARDYMRGLPRRINEQVEMSRVLRDRMVELARALDVVLARLSDLQTGLEQLNDAIATTATLARTIERWMPGAEGESDE